MLRQRKYVKINAKNQVNGGQIIALVHPLVWPTRKILDNNGAERPKLNKERMQAGADKETKH